jgi:TRAP-type C4-dicarboxylate transport system permease small subunit
MTRPATQRHPALRALAAAENALIIALLAGTALTILAQVLFRYALGRPLSWSTEVATDLLVYIAFVGFAIGIRDNAHVALHLFADRLGARSRRWLRIGELLVLGAVLGCIGVGGAMYAYQQRDVVSPSDIPLWVTFLSLPLGAVLGWLHLVVEILALVRGAPVPRLAGTVPEDATHDGAEPAAALRGGSA